MKFLSNSSNNVLPLHIALYGACHTDKTQLDVALRLSLQAAGWPVITWTDEPSGSRTSHLTFLLGLATSNKDQLATDQRIRTALSRLNTSYDVLYGSTDERLAQALRRIEKHRQHLEGSPPVKPLGKPLANPNSTKAQAWVWMCDKCSDPQCEHRLLTDLLAAQLTR